MDCKGVRRIIGSSLKNLHHHDHVHDDDDDDGTGKRV
jgi:hypothetical protein